MYEERRRCLKKADERAIKKWRDLARTDRQRHSELHVDFPSMLMMIAMEVDSPTAIDLSGSGACVGAHCGVNISQVLTR